MSYPDDRYYTEEHEWVRLEGGSCTVGVTSFAQEELGDIVFVELPDVGRTLAAGDEFGAIESVKALAEVYTPVAGRVAAVNEELTERPELINDDPHGDGWLIRLEAEEELDVSGLMDATAYAAFVSEDGE